MMYLIITTCINNKEGVKNNINREKRYIECIGQLLQLIGNDKTIKPIIVENNGVRSTYLDTLNCDIVYTDNNKETFKHKGQNELLDLKQVINSYKIQDDDIIIKITGRYKLLNLNFINLIKDNNETDAFIKFFNVATKKYMYNDCVLGLFSIKCKYLKEFKYNFLKSPEVEFAEYVRKNINEKRLIEVGALDLECCFANDLKILTV